MVIIPSVRSSGEEGKWSLFRVLDQAAKKVNGQSVDLSFKLNGGAINYRLTVENGTNPFFGGVLSNFRLPSKLLDPEKEGKSSLEPMEIYEEEVKFPESN